MISSVVMVAHCIYEEMKCWKDFSTLGLMAVPMISAVRVAGSPEASAANSGLNVTSLT